MDSVLVYGTVFSTPGCELGVDRGLCCKLVGWDARIEMTRQMLSNLATDAIAGFRIGTIRKGQIFDKILGYEGIKRTFLRSLKSTELVHILLVEQCISFIQV